MPELTSCPLCGHPECKPFRKDSGVQVVRCLACRFLFVNPRPTERELDHLYGLEYYPSDEKELGSSLDHRLPVFESGLKTLEGLTRPGRILDVGCGTGNFIRLAQDAGWGAIGVELSRGAAEYAQKRGLQVRAGILRDQHFSSDYFDVVTLWDVLEHLPEPRKELQEIHHVLKGGGFVVVRVPNTDFQLLKALLIDDILGRTRKGLQADLHLNHFTSGTLRDLLRRCGFEVFREEVGVSEDKVYSRGVPLWFKQWYCRLASVLNDHGWFHFGPTLVQYGRKVPAGSVAASS